MWLKRLLPDDAIAANAGVARRQDVPVLDAGRKSRAAVNERWSSLPGKLWSRLLRERATRRAAAELRALDDRELRDIGLSRGDIDFVARQAGRKLRL